MLAITVLFLLWSVEFKLVELIVKRRLHPSQLPPTQLPVLSSSSLVFRRCCYIWSVTHNAPDRAARDLRSQNQQLNPKGDLQGSDLMAMMGKREIEVLT